ncbi:hypothetical protein [Tenacibaculum sp. 190524A05c]|uniref:hypothetical protein n=1 Tax=Tenacibaculum platacis TaxID=3137852 RepID=UPI0032B1E943
MSTTIHYLKARNSDFLAGTDLEIFELEGRSKILTVKDVEYKENFKVNGKVKPKGIIMYFNEAYAKPLIVNTTNSKIIKDQTGTIDAKKWIGFSIEFYFNTNVELMRKRVGGIRIKKVDTNGLVPLKTDYKTRVENCSNLTELMSIWQDMNEDEQIEYQELFTVKRKSIA